MDTCVIKPINMTVKGLLVTRKNLLPVHGSLNNYIKKTSNNKTTIIWIIHVEGEQVSQDTWGSKVFRGLSF